VVSKLVAGRPKNRAFADAVIAAGLVSPGVLLKRVDRLEERVPLADRERLRRWVAAHLPG